MPHPPVQQPRGGIVPHPPVQQPRLSYKFQRLRERLRAAVQKGELRGKLPGERELARRFSANAKTISKALTDLTSEGLLIRQVGRGTFVADQANGTATAGRKCQYRLLSGAERSNGRDEKLCQLMTHRLSAVGHALMHERVPMDGEGKLPATWLSPANLREIDGVVILDALPERELVADLLRRHIPLVLTGTTAETIRTNTVLPDLARGAFELTEHLVLLGHQKIVLIAHDETAPPALEQVRRGYRAAMTRNQLTPLPDWVDAEPTAESLRRIESGVTAVVYCGPHGDRVRRLLAARSERPLLALLDAQGQFTETPAGDLTYTYAVEPIADWTVRLLLEAVPGHQAREVFVPGHLHTPTAARAASAIPPPETVAL